MLTAFFKPNQVSFLLQLRISAGLSKYAGKVISDRFCRCKNMQEKKKMQYQKNLFMQCTDRNKLYCDGIF